MPQAPIRDRALPLDLFTETVEFEFRNLVSQVLIDCEALQRPEIVLESLRHKTHALVLEVRAAVLERKLEPVVLKHEASWWDAFKARFAPRWFLKRWPVQYTEVRFEGYEVLQRQLALPRGESRVRLTSCRLNGTEVLYSRHGDRHAH